MFSDEPGDSKRSWSSKLGLIDSPPYIKLEPTDCPYEPLFDRQSQERYSEERKTASGEAEMSDFSRNELQALLKANKAEVDAVASSMRTEMANFRTSYVESFKDISITLNKIDGRIDATEKRLTQAQWVISLVISICAITLSVAISYSNANSNKSAPQPAIFIQPPQPVTITPVNPAPAQQK